MRFVGIEDPCLALLVRLLRGARVSVLSTVFQSSSSTGGEGSSWQLLVGHRWSLCTFTVGASSKEGLVLESYKGDPNRTDQSRGCGIRSEQQKAIVLCTSLNKGGTRAAPFTSVRTPSAGGAHREEAPQIAISSITSQSSSPIDQRNQPSCALSSSSERSAAISRMAGSMRPSPMMTARAAPALHSVGALSVPCHWREDSRRPAAPCTRPLACQLAQHETCNLVLGPAARRRRIKHCAPGGAARSTMLDLEQHLAPAPTPAPSLPPLAVLPQRALAYELVQGPLVRWTEARDRSLPPPPTAVLLHGILGCRRNWASFAKRLAQEFPSWQFLLVDLRCHGDSTLLPTRGAHSVASAAADVLLLMRQLKVIPRILIGHSFGGKVALSLVDQAAKPLARPVKVWVLDATPGTVRAGGNGEDRPAELIAALKRMPSKIPSRRAVVERLQAAGFSQSIAQWMTTNLRPQVNGSAAGAGAFEWTFDLDGISDMYQSYEATNLWDLVENVPQGVHINFLRAERSLHRWAMEDVTRIHAAESVASGEGAGVAYHVLGDAGHWVHTDNPEGLFQMLAPSFGGNSFLRS